MAFTTTYNGQIIIANAPEDIVFGTVMLGDIYGEIESASVSREADMEELKAAGSILACVLQNPKFQFECECTFRAGVTPPGLAELISFPFAGIQGRILPPIGIKWSASGHRMLTIKATSWDKWIGLNDGGGDAQVFDGAGYTPIT